MAKGNLFVVSAPSGAGKTSLVKRLRAELDGLAVSVSHTTRAQRPGEVHGQDYFFIGRETFERMIGEAAFLEHARVFDNYYGTAQSSVETALLRGEDVVLEIDWQGARQVRHLLPDCLSVFILPPSLATLSQRLQGRGQDSADVIQRRMSDAIAEMSHYAEYDYLLVNDDFEVALRELKSIIIATRLREPRQSDALSGLLQALLA
ncbi:MAG: guanylate kinase [Methylococcaceae bacterium]|nr:MAG: guanylate kinase [Methylococcaceae bacterium]